MPVAVLQQPRWRQDALEEYFVQNATWPEIESAIRQLDQSNWQDIYLLPDSTDTNTWLCVGGGNGHFIVTGSIAAKEFPTYVGSPGATGTRLMTVGGQAGDYPASWVVPLDQALEAVHAISWPAVLSVASSGNQHERGASEA